MTRASTPHPHARLAALGLLSLALHAALLAWLARPDPASHARVGAGLPMLRVQLTRTQAPASVDARAHVAARAPAPVASSTAAPASAPAPEPAPAPTPSPAVARTPDAAPPSAGSATSASPAPSGAAPDPDDDEPTTSRRYRVRPPPSTTLAYAVSRGAPGQAARPAGAARLAWSTDEQRYTLRLDGVPDQLDGQPSQHSTTSEGGFDDNGIAPGSAAELRAGADDKVTTFDQMAGMIKFAGGQRETRLVQGSQDQASVLLQLASMGVAEPLQMQGTIEIDVGGGGALRAMRFDVVGEETLNTPLGPMAVLHLVQQPRAGQARLEVWLAPTLHWLPVQLRDTWPDGSVATRLLTRVDAPAPAR